MTVEVGQVIDGKYRVVKLLGKGGMGAVYLAEHLVIGRRVALKVLLGGLAENETAVARFEREAQAAARIGSDHILEIYDFGSLPDHARYMVCEFLDGETLADRLERERQLSPHAVVPLACQLLNGLAAAHAAGVVHRDLKPENIFILRQKAGIADFVKIIDFGISKFQQLTAEEGMQMTATGVVVGTPCYLSPEQARGSRDADARSDVYAVGVILYEAVTGQLPFDAQNVNDLLFKIVLEEPRPLRALAPQLDEDFARIIEVAMARAPEQRFESAASFLQALERWASSRGVPLVATSRITGSGVTGIGVTGGGVTGIGVSGNGVSGTGPTAAVDVPERVRSLAPTPGTWADSKISVAAFRAPPKSRRLLVAGLAVGVLGVGGAFAFMSSGSGSDAVATVPSTPSSSANRASAQPVVTAAPTPADLVVPPAPTGDPQALLAPLEGEAPPKPAPALPKPPRAPAISKTVAPKPARTGSPPAATSSAPKPTSKPRRDFGY